MTYEDDSEESSIIIDFREMELKKKIEEQRRKQFDNVRIISY